MVGIYCRISKQKVKGQDVSIETQRQSGIEFAKSIGMEFRTFIDEGISGTGDDLTKRPEFVLLLDSIKKGEISKVYCIDQSRIERNNDIWNLFTHTMLKAGCLYFPNGKFLDLEMLENKLFTGIISLTNTFYAALTGKKVKMAINANAKKGKTHGLTAYGYMKGEGGFFKINEEQAVTVKQIFQMSLNGIGTYTIANNLNKQGIRTKFSHFNGQIRRKDKYTNQITLYSKGNVKWRGNVIHDIIKNPIYKGTRIWNDEFVPVPAIISEDHWQQVNDNLENNKKKVGKREEYHYLLNGLVFCADCKSEFRGKKRLKGRDTAYKCKGKSNHDIHCNARGISIAKLETFIIKHLFISKDLQEYLSGLSENKKESDNLKLKLANEKKELDHLKRLEKHTYKLLLDPDLEDDLTIKEDLKTTKKYIGNKESAIEILENKLIERDAHSRSKRVKNTIGEYSLNAGFEDTKKLIHSLIKKITIKHNYRNESKGGIFHVNIEYKGFDESSMFMTDWQALKWYWMGHYRSKAITKEDLEDDKELFKYLAETSGKKIQIPDNFAGFESYSSGSTLIELEKEDLINFD